MQNIAYKEKQRLNDGIVPSLYEHDISSLLPSVTAFDLQQQHNKSTASKIRPSPPQPDTSPNASSRRTPSAFDGGTTAGRGDGCYECGAAGHFGRDCPVRAANGGRRGPTHGGGVAPLAADPRRNAASPTS